MGARSLKRTTFDVTYLVFTFSNDILIMIIDDSLNNSRAAVIRVERSFAI